MIGPQAMAMYGNVGKYVNFAIFFLNNRATTFSFSNSFCEEYMIFYSVRLSSYLQEKSWWLLAIHFFYLVSLYAGTEFLVFSFSHFFYLVCFIGITRVISCFLLTCLYLVCFICQISVDIT